MSAPQPFPASRYLIDDRPLVVKLQLVRLIGFKPAVVLQQVRYWLGEDRRPRVRDGQPWVYNTYAEWQKQFPFWPASTIKETFLELEREGLLLSGHFNARNTDRTKWYTIPPHVIRDLDRRARAEAGPGARRRDAGALPDLPESGLLIDRDTLIILPHLAAAIGLNEALVLQQVYYWLGGDRKPHVRDGRRWVYNTYEGWREQFPFWSERTIRRTIRELERRGLLEAAYFADHPDHRHLDHTKWYTIDFARLAALDPADQPGTPDAGDPGAPGSPWVAAPLRTAGRGPDAGTGQKPPIEPATFGRSNRTESDAGSGQGPTLETANAARSNRPELAAATAGTGRGHRPKTAAEPAKNRRSTHPETIPEISTQITQKQQQASPGAVAGREAGGVDDVVVVDDVIPDVAPDSDLAAHLVDRGITPTSARTLLATQPAATVALQIEAFDWLREGDPDDSRYTAGRLRRMIEEDWALPPGFLPASERAARDAAARRAALERAAARQAAAAADREREALRRAARRERLDRLGLREEDQALWQGLVVQPPALPRFLAEAYFCPPPPGTGTAALVFDDAGACARAAALPRDAGARLRDRLARRYRLVDVEIAHFVYAELLEQLAEGGAASAD